MSLFNRPNKISEEMPTYEAVTKLTSYWLNEQGSIPIRGR
jgi:hypothetical protein